MEKIVKINHNKFAAIEEHRHFQNDRLLLAEGSFINCIGMINLFE
jgi:hypothetical protein